jgi:hypothetical protein
MDVVVLQPEPALLGSKNISILYTHINSGFILAALCTVFRMKLVEKFKNARK